MHLDELTNKVERIDQRVDNVSNRLDLEISKLKKRTGYLEDHLILKTKILSINDVATMINMKPSSIYKLSKAGKIPYHRPTNGKLMFLLDEVSIWLREDLNPGDIMELVKKNEEKFQEAFSKQENE